jgi:hypothetical protein
MEEKILDNRLDLHLQEVLAMNLNQSLIQHLRPKFFKQLKPSNNLSKEWKATWLH